MSVLTQLVQSREAWSNAYRANAERKRNRRAILEFVFVVILGVAAFLFHARLIEWAGTFFKGF